MTPPARPRRAAMLAATLLALTLAGCAGPADQPAVSPTSPPTPTTPATLRATPRTPTGVRGEPSHGGPLRDHVSFVDHLRGRRLQVVPSDSVRYPFLRGEGIVLRVSGPTLARPAELHSFWYDPFKLGMDPTQAAAEDAAGIAADGTPPGGAPAWAGPPHFFRKAHALVLYVGDDPALLALLTDLLGPQFAGR